MRGLTKVLSTSIFFLLAVHLLGRDVFAQEEILLPRSLMMDQGAAPPQKVPAGPGEEKEDPDQLAFYPIPAIGAGKNEGWTFGLLGALLIPDKHGDINQVVSAALQYRANISVNGFLDFRWTTSPTGAFEVYTYWARDIENENQFFYDEKR